MKKQITTAEILVAAGAAVIVYGVGRLHPEFAIILAGLFLVVAGMVVALAGKPR